MIFTMPWCGIQITPAYTCPKYVTLHIMFWFAYLTRSGTLWTVFEASCQVQVFSGRFQTSLEWFTRGKMGRALLRSRVASRGSGRPIGFNNRKLKHWSTAWIPVEQRAGVREKRLIWFQTEVTETRTRVYILRRNRVEYLWWQVNT